jgi:molybdate transport system substrate-binding protein
MRNSFLRKALFSFFMVLFFGVNVAGCNFKPQKRLTISVPCSIFAAFCEILDAYKKDNPGVKIDFDTGNTIVLMRKVLYQGARPDIYMATGPKEIDPLVEKGLVMVSSKTAMAADSIILATSSANPKNIQRLSDLASSNVKSIAIPDPATNSSGNAAVEALKKLNLWDTVKDKVTYTEFGRHTRNYIMKNKIDAGIIYKSCLYEDLKAYQEVIVPKQIFVVADILKETGGKIQSWICILESSKNKALAQEFLDYMLSPRAQAVLKKWEGKEIKN